MGPAAQVGGAPVRIVLTVAYDGTGFHGFARQPGLRTVAGELAAAIGRVARCDVDPVCAGRTDAGVHAWGQVVHVDLPAAGCDATPPARLQRSLVSQLAPEIVVRDVALAPAGFHARHSARARRYRYRIVEGRAHPLLARVAWEVPGALDVKAMELATIPLIGLHDFSAFCRRPSERRSSAAGGDPLAADGSPPAAEGGPGEQPAAGEEPEREKQPAAGEEPEREEQPAAGKPAPLLRHVMSARWWRERPDAFSDPGDAWDREVAGYAGYAGVAGVAGYAGVAGDAVADEATWDGEALGPLVFEIEARSFCHTMVRSIVGTLADVGRHTRRASDVVDLLASGDRRLAGTIAPPHGLCLMAVRYDAAWR